MARDDKQIAKLRERFVCVRITQMNGVNLRRFQFDLDTTWAAFFLDAKLNVYSRYGGRDDGEPEDRMSKASFLHTMRAVLAVHERAKAQPTKARARHWQPVEPGVFRPRDIPLLGKHHNGCVHCHQIREYQYLQAAKTGTFTRRLLFDWPLPEKLGVTFDRAHGHRVAKVAKASAAAKAGLRPGDVVTRVDGVPIHSECDVRWALDRVKDGSHIHWAVLRSRNGTSTTHTIKLRPSKRWRETELAWRKSLRSVPLMFEFRGYALRRSQRRRLKLSEDVLAIRVVSASEKGLAGSLKLQKGDLIVEADGKSHHRTIEELQSDLLRRHRPGSAVRFVVLREGRKTVLRARFPDWKTNETTVP